MNLVNTRVKTGRQRSRGNLYSWMWRLPLAVLLGWWTYTNIVPWAAAQRGCTALGGEFMLVLGAFMLPLCIFRH